MSGSLALSDTAACYEKMSHLTAVLLVLASLFLGPSRQLSPAQLGAEQPSYVLEPGEELTARILIENASNVYGIDVRASYDPSLVEVVDADPGRDGVQVFPGEFPQPDFLAVNSANPRTGEIRYVTTQLNPTPAASGSGVVFAVRLRGRGVSGSSQFRIESVEMSSRDGTLLPVQWSGATIETGGESTQAPVGQATGVALVPATVVVPSATPTSTEALPDTSTPVAPVATPTSIPATGTEVTTLTGNAATSQLATEQAQAASVSELASAATQQSEAVPPVATEPVSLAIQTATPDTVEPDSNTIEAGGDPPVESLTQVPDSTAGLSVDTVRPSPDAFAVVGDNTEPAADEVATANASPDGRNQPVWILVVAATIALAVSAFLVWLRRMR